MPPTNADYAKINIACNELGLDKHQLISDRYRVESSKDLTLWQLQDLYKHFRALGWQAKPGSKSNLSPKYDDRQHRKIVAMWITLHKEGVIRNQSDHALQTFVKGQTGIDNLKWCGGQEAFKLIEALKAMGKRAGVDFD
ncbi:MAG: regulatory protein GemA [Proteobacteria bacterium]|nr:regulatory protein GemA [Pseudomonadota bacterium]